MQSTVRLSPYRSDRQYARLETYRRLGLPDALWAREQFGLRVRFSTAGAPDYGSRVAGIWETVDRLPLQVKDILRGLIDEVRLDHAASFQPDTLGTWRDGVMRLNRDWSLMPALSHTRWHRDLGYDLLQATLVHEAGHALVEDPRGGIPLRDLLGLVAASGWLPHPVVDPVPFGTVGARVDTLAEYYLDRLRRLDPSWDGESPLGSPGMPSRMQLDRDTMHSVDRPTLVWSKDRGSLGLQGPEELLRRLRSEDPERLERRLAAKDLSLEAVDAALRRRRALSPYSEESIQETPAEIFRYLQASFSRSERSRPAVEEGERVLLDPWRSAERALGGRQPALSPPRPWEAIHLIRRGFGRELGR